MSFDTPLSSTVITVIDNNANTVNASTSGTYIESNGEIIHNDDDFEIVEFETEAVRYIYI